MKLQLLKEQLKAYLEQPLRNLKSCIALLSVLMLFACVVLTPIIVLCDPPILGRDGYLLFLFIYATSMFLFGCFFESRLYQISGIIFISIFICLTVELYYR